VPSNINSLFTARYWPKPVALDIDVTTSDPVPISALEIATHIGYNTYVSEDRKQLDLFREICVFLK
jgi:hypothetical protein